MKICASWLEEWLGEPLDPEPVAEVLTMAGLEVESLQPVAASASGLVVGQVRSVQPHPNADRLKLCEVDAGGADLLPVVCGAPNVRKRMHAPFAPVGARVGDLKISEIKIRGETSRGMLCSAAELGLGEDAEGILDLGGSVAAGTDLREYLELDDVVFDLDLTPNRSDCFSVLGVAREIAAIRGGALQTLPQDAVVAELDETFAVEVADCAACPRYLARVVRDVAADAETPLWMRERLRRCGVRAVHPVVDVMNYVMIELGQPLHAFDLDKIEAPITVRCARAGESLDLLGGGRAEPDESTLLITDARGPIAMAGVIGGADCAVSETTRNVLIECAFFAPRAIMGRARSYGLHTDASLRFERGVDPTLQQRAMERACELLGEVAGGRFGPVTEAAAEQASLAPRPIELRYDALARRLGVEVERNEVSKMLIRLGCRMKPCRGGWHCTPPPHRFDLEIEEDLIEEVGRLYGYDKIAARDADGAIVSTVSVREPLDGRRERDDRWCDVLVDRGYLEAVTYSFIDPDWAEAVSGRSAPVLGNPVSPASSVMRPSLWPGLLKALLHNLNRQQERVRLFELGRRFDAGDEEGEPREVPTLAGLICGRAHPEQWGASSRACDFHDLKGDVESLFGRDAAGLSYEQTTHPGLHPGQGVDVLLDGKRIGCLGALNPVVAERVSVDRDVFVFELDVDALDAPGPVQVEEVSRYPSVRRDVSITVPADVAAARVVKCIRELGIAALREVVIFDVYAGDKVEEGRKSMTLGLIFQDVSSTLNDETCTGLVDDVTAALAESLEANLRT